LAVARLGPKLEPAKAGGCVVYNRNNLPPKPEAGEPRSVLCGSLRESPKGGFDIPGATMAGLCRQLSAYVDREIVDKTGIEGTFDVHLDQTRADLFYPDAAPDPSSPFTPGDGGAIASALKELGLQMRPGKGSAQSLVIDHVEKPSEN
jgi:uncharacterized protein (TIGR03435 family)